MRATCTGPMCMPGTLLVSSCQEFLIIQFLYGLARSEGRGVTKTRTSKAQTSDPEKLTPPGRLENTDPQFNIFQMSILLSTFNFQLAIYQSTKRGVAWYLRHVSRQFIPLKWTNKSAVFKYGYDQEWYHRAIQVDYDTTPSFREWLGILNLREFFCLLDNLRKIPDNLHVYSGWPRKHLCPGNHLVVLKKYVYKNKKERKQGNKEVLLGYVFVCVVTSTSSLARLIYVPPENHPQNEEHSRRLVTVQLILQQIFSVFLCSLSCLIRLSLSGIAQRI